MPDSFDWVARHNLTTEPLYPYTASTPPLKLPHADAFDWVARHNLTTEPLYPYATAAGRCRSRLLAALRSDQAAGPLRGQGYVQVQTQSAEALRRAVAARPVVAYLQGEWASWQAQGVGGWGEGVGEGVGWEGWRGGVCSGA